MSKLAQIRDGYLPEEIDDFGIWQKVDACARQQSSELIAVLKGALDWIKVLFILFSLVFLGGEATLKSLHDLEELHEAQPVVKMVVFVAIFLVHHGLPLLVLKINHKLICL